MRAGLKDDPAGNFFQLGQIATQSPLVGDGLLQGSELGGGQRHRDGFSRHFARPLVTGTAALAGRAVLDGPLADIPELAQAAAVLLKLPLQRFQREDFFLHRAHFSLPVKPCPVIILAMNMDTPFFPVWRARLAAFGLRAPSLRALPLPHIENGAWCLPHAEANS